MKTLTEIKTIRNLYSYLKHTDADEIIVRTSYVSGGWHDNEFDANAAGFDIVKFFNPEYEKLHQFSECYKFTRKKDTLDQAMDLKAKYEKEMNIDCYVMERDGKYKVAIGEDDMQYAISLGWEQID